VSCGPILLRANADQKGSSSCIGIPAAQILLAPVDEFFASRLVHTQSSDFVNRR
jgi:hypothetical protein